ncbi:MAG: alpha/beta hydrolase [Chitinophagaceae bacterium]
MKFLKYLLAGFSLLVLVYFLGPHPKNPQVTSDLPVIQDTGAALEARISKMESGFNVKPDNEARIIWNNDSLKQKTEYAIVYLHGFSASQEEGDPVHTDLAKKMGANLYLSRLDAHGLSDPESMMHLTAQGLWETTKMAYAIGKNLGRKVIVMGTSTGCTLALMLAAQQYPEIAGLILISPNIEINNKDAYLLNNPWGLQLARAIMGSDYIEVKDTTSIYKKYWYTHYRMESTVELQELLETQMTPETFKKVNQPTLMLYYYKDEQHQDPVVKVSAMKTMFEQLATSSELKKAVAIPNGGNHVLGSYIKSNDLPAVEKEITAYALQQRWIK